jgi:hypothetical protein
MSNQESEANLLYRRRMEYLKNKFLPQQQGKIATEPRKNNPIADILEQGEYRHYLNRIRELKAKWKLPDGLQVHGVAQKKDEISVQEAANQFDREQAKDMKLCYGTAQFTDGRAVRLYFTIKR